MVQRLIDAGAQVVFGIADDFFRQLFLFRRFVADNKTGCRFLTVDAYADAVPFYLKNGFMPLNDDDLYDATRLLFFDLVYIIDEISR